MKNENMVKIDGRNVSTEIFNILLDVAESDTPILSHSIRTIESIFRIINLPNESYCRTVLVDFVSHPDKYLFNESNLKTLYDAVVREFGKPYMGNPEEDSSYRIDYEYILSTFKGYMFIR